MKRVPEPPSGRKERQSVLVDSYYRSDGRPASPSASSSTSRRYSLQPGVDKSISKQLIGSKRLVDASLGRLDPAQWESCANCPVTFRDCLRVSVHLYASTHIFERVFLDFIHLSKVQELLWGLLFYFKELFSLADALRSIVPPALGDSHALGKKWTQSLSEVLKPLTTTYGHLILGQGLGNLHHMKCGRSLHSNGRLDNDLFENLYGVAELLVWVVFRRRDRNGIGQELRRLFRGDLGQSAINTKTPPTKLMGQCTGLLHDPVPPMTIAFRLDDAQILAPLHYVTVDGAETTDDHTGETQVVQGHGMGLIGSRRGDLNEYLEPPLPEDEDDDLSLG